MGDEIESKDLETQLRQWREERGRKPAEQVSVSAGKRTVKVNGQNVVVVKRARNKNSG